MHVSTVLAIDPGQCKCGVAVVREREGAFEALYQGVAPTADLPALLADLAGRYQPETAVVGDGTNSSEIVRIAEKAQTAPVVTIDEKFSTILARERFFRHNPPRGFRRLIPLSLQTPNRPYDDYVAIILAERYLSS